MGSVKGVRGGLVMLAALLATGVGVAAGTSSASSATGVQTLSTPFSTPSGWRVTPVGKLITVPAGDLGLPGPWGVALSPDGKRALVSSSGAAVLYETTELYDLTTDKRTALRRYDARKGKSVFYGVVFSPTAVGPGRQAPVRTSSTRTRSGQAVG